MNEHDYAMRDAAMAEFVDSYFKARPQLLRTRHEECLVEAGFKAAWKPDQTERAEKAEAELAQLREQKPVVMPRFCDDAISGLETMVLWLEMLSRGECFARSKNLADDPGMRKATIKDAMKYADMCIDRIRPALAELEQFTIKYCGTAANHGLMNADLYAAPVPAVSDKRVDELAMLIRRLVRRLNQELPHNDIGEAAMDYLARNGISGEILRGWAAPAVPAANPVQWLEDEGDNILVPRGLLGAACSAIENHRKAEKVLDAMRYYTMNAPQAPIVADCCVSQDDAAPIPAPAAQAPQGATCKKPLQVPNEWREVLSGLIAIAEKKGKKQGSPNHSHRRTNIWDDDNGPDLAGKPCFECAMYDKARALLQEVKS